MSDIVFEEDNDLARNNCDKLYLDPTTADVNFVFGDDVEGIPAHKILLSVVSQVFHTMFYGSLPEKGDILIKDATPDAFKEFLQFFYLNKVRLSSEHIFQVVNLCKKYEMVDALKRCEATMQKSLTSNNMCTGYAVALLLEMNTIVEFCEQKIKVTASEVLKSADFLDCDSIILDKILQLVTSECGASEIVDACMEWAKSKCEQQKMRVGPVTMKTQLKSSLERIPFAELNKEQFAKFIDAYNGFFLKKDLETMILEVMSKNEKLAVPSPPPPFVLHCDRQKANSSNDLVRIPLPNVSRFKTNKRLLLTEFHVGSFVHTNELLVRATISYDGDKITQTDVSLIPGVTTRVVLPKPVLIDEGETYKIVIKRVRKADLRGTNNFAFKKKPFANPIKMRDGIEVNFLTENSIITRLVFHEFIEN